MNAKHECNGLSSQSLVKLLAGPNRAMQALAFETTEKLLAMSDENLHTTLSMQQITLYSAVEVSTEPFTELRAHGF